MKILLTVAILFISHSFAQIGTGTPPVAFLPFAAHMASGSFDDDSKEFVKAFQSASVKCNSVIMVSPTDNFVNVGVLLQLRATNAHESEALCGPHDPYVTCLQNDGRFMNSLKVLLAYPTLESRVASTYKLDNKSAENLIKFYKKFVDHQK